MEWAKAPERRDQLVLYSQRLDNIVGAGHRVRLLDEILAQLDWTKWEAAYHLERGQPPIHPRVLAAVVLYGLLVRIRSSRALEEALEIRSDFRWLVEGRSIDHTTLCKFRRKNAAALKDLFVQVGLLARQLGWLPLETLAFDGTRIRANNRRGGARTPAELRALKQELAEKFAAQEAQIQQLDDQEEELFGQETSHRLSRELSDTVRRQMLIETALTQIKRLAAEGHAVPARVPMADPQSRILPNKDGGYAPNYTPLATVDVDSGLIVSAEVIDHPEEDKRLLPALRDVQEQFGLEQCPGQILADGLMATGENIAACQREGIELYSPPGDTFVPDNPALREDFSEPVPEAAWGRLPIRQVKHNGQTIEKLDQQAFIYDEVHDCYWCPAGKRLGYRTTVDDPQENRVRRTYRSSARECRDCPLRLRCLGPRGRSRQLRRDQHETARTRHARKMGLPESRRIYARRRHAGERPFAMIKHHFGVRSFLHRGLERVGQEWTWLTTAFNLHRLMGLLTGNTGPPRESLRLLSSGK